MDSRICPSCGQETAAKVDICLSCGKSAKFTDAMKPPPEPPKVEKAKINKNLKICKDCGHEISKRAESCPNCGAVEKKTSKITWLGVGLLALVIISIAGKTHRAFKEKQESPINTSTTHAAPTAPKEKPKQLIFNENETVSIGYTSYKAWESWWSSGLSDNKFLNDQADSKYLFVRLSVRNDDKKPRTIPPFRLVDQNGAEYEASSKGWRVQGSIGILSSLNPDVAKEGVVVFDVPTGRKYGLKISGGYFSGESALIKLSPRPNP